MPSVSEHIQQFRGIVDGAIEQNIANKRYSWPDMNTHAEYGGMSYVSVEPTDGRPMSFGRLEAHAWAIIQPRRRVGGYVGDLALVSVAGEDEILRRKWSVKTPMPMIDALTERIVDNPEEIGRVVLWAVSPHIHGRTIEDIAALSEDENAHIAARFESASAGQRDYERDIEEINRAERRAWNDASNIIIG